MNNDKKQSIIKKRKNKSKIKSNNFTKLSDYLWECLDCNVSAQSYGPGVEKFIIARSNNRLEKDKCNVSGDAKDKLTKNSYEIKSTIANINGGINFVQLRPHYNASHYIFVVFDPELDLIESIVLEKSTIKDLIVKYGGYAHGSIEKQGKITEQNIRNNQYEYALRPNTKNNCELLKEIRKNNQIDKKEWQWLKTIIN